MTSRLGVPDITSGVSPSDESDGDDELGVDVREPCELGLVEVHDEQFVGRRQLGRFVRELTIEIAYVFHGFLHVTQTDAHITESNQRTGPVARLNFNLLECRGN